MDMHISYLIDLIDWFIIIIYYYGRLRLIKWRSEIKLGETSGSTVSLQIVSVFQETRKPAEEEEVEIPETRIDVDMPKIWTELGKELHFVKLPNFLSVETRPYDHNTYEDEIDEEETLDEEGRARWVGLFYI